MINEANEPSSACRLQRIFKVETSTPPDNAGSIGPAGWKRKTDLEDSVGQAGGSEETVDHDAEHAQRALIFQAFGGFLDFLEREFGVLVEGVIIDQLADRALAAIHFFQEDRKSVV